MARDLVTPRPWYAKIPFVSTSALPSKIISGDTQLLMTPEATVSWLGPTSFGWLGDLLSLGYAQPLEKSDLNRLPPSRDSAKYAARIEEVFQRRKTHADEINVKIENRELRPPLRLRPVCAMTSDSISKMSVNFFFTRFPPAKPRWVPHCKRRINL